MPIICRRNNKQAAVYTDANVLRARVHILKLSKSKKMRCIFFLNFKNEKMKMYNFDIEK